MLKRIVSVVISVIFFSAVICVQTDASAPYEDAEAFVVINAVTESVLEGKDIHKRLPMASTTKIMTAIVMCSLVEDMEQEIVTTEEMVTVEGSSMGLLPGDTVSYKALLYGLLLASGNDAANTIAISLCGSTDAFVEKMNQKAREMGLENTNFETPSGLDGDNHYTSAYDLARIAAHALRIPLIAEAVATQKAVLYYGNPPYRRSITNHNKLIGSYDGAIGVKTGFTKKSGRCLVSAVKRGEATVIAVTLNAANDYENHKFLIENNIKKLTEYSLPKPTEDLTVHSAEGATVPVKVNEASVALQEENVADISYKIYLPSIVYAPKALGDRVGWVDYYYGEVKIATADIVLAQQMDMPAKRKKNYIDKLFEFFISMLKFQ